MPADLDLTTRLRALAHVDDDDTVATGYEAADEIERLTAEVLDACQAADAAQAECNALVARVADLDAAHKDACFKWQTAIQDRDRPAPQDNEPHVIHLSTCARAPYLLGLVERRGAKECDCIAPAPPEGSDR